MTPELIRRSTEPGDDLCNPLVPTRRTAICDDPDAVLVRAFFCAIPSGSDVLTNALGGDLFRACCDAGVLVESESGWASPFHVRPVRNLYLWSDYLGPEAHPAAVMGAGETTAVLYRAAYPRQRLRSALDLGCGAGTLALLLAGTVDQVVGTDVNSRAVAMAQANAALNGITNVEFRTGSIYDPVDAERFDLIVSQPPYYPDPAMGGGQVYLHGGPAGDELASAVVAGAPDHLNPCGRALVFTSWPANRIVPELPEIRVMELATNRRELNGTRQSISVIEHASCAEGWTARFEVSAECWGNVEPGRIDEIIVAEQLARGSDEAMLGSRLRLPHGGEFLREGTDVCLRTAPTALIGNVPISEQVEADLRAINSAPDARCAGVAPDRVRGYLRRGLLLVA